MSVILIQEHLTEHELLALKTEFTNYHLLYSDKNEIDRDLTPALWGRVEVLFGDSLKSSHLRIAPQLRWIHSPSPFLDKLCRENIQSKGNILLSNTRGENILQIAEFVAAGYLAFAKRLFFWKEGGDPNRENWIDTTRASMWSMKDRTLLQIGLGTIGSAIAERSQKLGFRVWGLNSSRSYHPNCDRTFGMNKLHSLLPNVDAVSICLPRGNEYNGFFGRHELELMREDSLLSIIGSQRAVNLDALAEIGARKMFRGIILDMMGDPLPPKNAPLWKLPNLLLTPEAAPYPLSKERLGYRIFRYNLRQYIKGNITDMRYLISPGNNLNQEAD